MVREGVRGGVGLDHRKALIIVRSFDVILFFSVFIIFCKLNLFIYLMLFYLQ